MNGLSSADKTLSQSDQEAIKKYKSDWQAAYDRGDQSGMDAAHAAAEGVRAKRGYSGGSDGSGYIARPANSGGNNVGQVQDWVSQYEYDNYDAGRGWINGYSDDMNMRSMANFIRQQMKANSDAWASADEAGKAYLHDQNLQLAQVLEKTVGGAKSTYNAELGRWETENANLGYGYNIGQYQDEDWYKEQYGMTDEQIEHYRNDTDRYYNFVDQGILRSFYDESNGFTGKYAQFVNGPYGQLLMGTNGVNAATYSDRIGDGFADELEYKPQRDAQGNIVPRTPPLKNNNSLNDYTAQFTSRTDNGIIYPGKLVETNPGGGMNGAAGLPAVRPGQNRQERQISGVGTLEQWQQSAMEQAAASRDHAVDKAVQALLRAQQEAEARYQTQRDQIAKEELQGLDNAALYAETRGDRGGIGLSQYNRVRAQADANRQTVSNAQTQLASDTAQQITRLRADGEFEKADDMMQIAQTYLLKLLELEQWAAEYSLDVEKFEESVRQWEKEYQLSLARALI